jgi:hypothetical protein
MINSLINNLKNIPGKGIGKKALIIESDDWGSTRIPSLNVYLKLKEANFDLDKSNFTKYDTLESAEDLEKLFEVLRSFSDINGNAVKFTPFVNVVNPDFVKIKENNYSNYIYETFDKSLIRERGSNTMSRWLQGVKQNLFTPEFHGREHYNVQLLMKLLNSNEQNIRLAFDLGVVHIPLSKNYGYNGSLAPSYYYTNELECKEKIESIIDGLDIFKKIIGREAKCFVPSNGIFDDKLEIAFANTNIKSIVADRERREPDLIGGFNKKSFALKFGKKNSFGQRYYSRNCKFEPIQLNYRLKDVINQIDSAFLMGKPAIVSSHRINYVGSIDENVRAKSLEELYKLLEIVTKKHPDVHFLSSGEFSDLLNA